MPSRQDNFAILPAGTAVVCHDAGAANVIVAGLQQARRRDLRACMQGPAARIWKQAYGQTAPYNSLEEALEGASFVLSGTGWASELEHQTRILARKTGVRSVAVLDHWVNYPQRFERHSKTVLPDEIWVSDADAWRLAQACFPGQALRLVKNWYLQQQLDQIIKPNIDARPELLYLAEPVRSDWGKEQPGEFQALDYFANKLPLLDLPSDTRVRLRPHPSDEPGKYDAWIAGHPHLQVVLDDTASMAEALGRAHWVAGCESYGLVLALAAERTVFCVLPPWAPPCRLPQAGLIHVASLDQ